MGVMAVLDYDVCQNAFRRMLRVKKQTDPQKLKCTIRLLTLKIDNLENAAEKTELDWTYIAMLKSVLEFTEQHLSDVTVACTI